MRLSFNLSNHYTSEIQITFKPDSMMPKSNMPFGQTYEKCNRHEHISPLTSCTPIGTHGDPLQNRFKTYSMYPCEKLIHIREAHPEGLSNHYNVNIYALI